MDSFYDQPRNAPIPTSIDQIPSSQVPEVSILIPPDLKASKQKQPAEKNLSYNVWKTQTQKRLERAPKTRYNKENEIVNDADEFSSQNVSKEIFRKHVRFNSPQVQKQILQLSNVNSYINGSDKGMLPTEPAYTCNNNEKAKTVSSMPFEQIYMANIPNRHLDVSLMEPPNYASKETKAGNGKQEIFDKSTNMLFLDKINNKHIEHRSTEETCKSQKNFSRSTYPVLQKPSNCSLEVYNHQLQPANYKSQDDNNDATIKDLVKVIQQQNEQILLLQKQVSLLLQNQLEQKQAQVPVLKENPPNPPGPTRNPEENAQCDRYHNQKGPLSKFAIDVMTSFEVSIRSPNVPHNNLIDECSASPKIQEIADTTASKFDKEKINSDIVYGNIKNGIDEGGEVKQNTDLSLILDKPIEIVDRCPSPVNSVHVDMKDYSSDSDDDSHGPSADVGWTVYNNIMGQVNDLIKKANTDMQDMPCSSNSNVVTNKTLKQVQEATMRHLKSIGVNLPVVERPNASQRSNETVNGSEYTPTEVSFAVKQLLMKYLPDDQLTKIPQTPNTKHVPKENVNCKGENLIKRRPEFSFATLQYMQKYNLLTSGTIHQEPQQATKNSEIPKILDVTALKQQPKLL